MSMRIVYLKTHDGNKPGTDKFTERSLARRLCESGVALPYVTWRKQQDDTKKRIETAAMEMKAKPKAEVKKAAEEKADPEPEKEEKPKTRKTKKG
jgi:hypothetical protein